MIPETCALHEQVARQLQALILIGELRPGQRIVEDQIAKRLGVSRNPVREAIRSLEESGLLEVKPRRGASVRELSESEIHHLQQIRILLEGYAVEQAAIRRNPEDIQQAEQCLRAGRQAAAYGDLISSASFHRDFHRAVERASGVEILVRLLNTTWRQAGLLASRATERRGMILWDEHQGILEAISAGDGERAKELSRLHIVKGVESLNEPCEAEAEAESVAASP